MFSGAGPDGDADTDVCPDVAAPDVAPDVARGADSVATGTGAATSFPSPPILNVATGLPLL